jgi:hypothetical protein
VPSAYTGRMRIEMHFIPVPGPTSEPIFVPNVILGTDQAGLIPVIGDIITGTNRHTHTVKSRNFTFTTASVLVEITCSLATS